MAQMKTPEVDYFSYSAAAVMWFPRTTFFSSVALLHVFIFYLIYASKAFGAPWMAVNRRAGSPSCEMKAG